MIQQISDFELELISLASVVKICETLNCDLADVIALVPDDEE